MQVTRTKQQQEESFNPTIEAIACNRSFPMQAQLGEIFANTVLELFRNRVSIFELESVQAAEVKSPLEFEKKKNVGSRRYRKVIFASTYVKYQ